MAFISGLELLMSEQGFERKVERVKELFGTGEHQSEVEDLEEDGLHLREAWSRSQR